MKTAHHTNLIRYLGNLEKHLVVGGGKNLIWLYAEKEDGGLDNILEL